MVGVILASCGGGMASLPTMTRDRILDDPRGEISD
jgi:hypothetical protein